jgi:hypothetical protein
MQRLNICLFCFSVHHGHYVLPYMAPDLNEVWVLIQGVDDSWG